MTIKAASDRIVLIPEPVKEQIYIPDTSLKKPQRGTVVSVGELCKEVKPGYEIYFIEGHGVRIDDKLIITEKDVLGYVPDAKFFIDSIIIKRKLFYDELFEVNSPVKKDLLNKIYPYPGDKYLESKLNEDISVIRWVISQI